MDIDFTFNPTTGDLSAHVNLGDRTTLAEQTPRGAANLVTEMAEEFRTKLGEFTDWLRANNTQSAPGETLTAKLPSVTQSPSCTGCGTAVGAPGELCAECEHKQHLRAPEPRIAIASQGEPLYKREGNFRDVSVATTEQNALDVGVSE